MWPVEWSHPGCATNKEKVAVVLLKLFVLGGGKETRKKKIHLCAKLHIKARLRQAMVR
jgi:hypothetical protein